MRQSLDTNTNIENIYKLTEYKSKPVLNNSVKDIIDDSLGDGIKFTNQTISLTSHISIFYIIMHLNKSCIYFYNYLIDI